MKNSMILDYFYGQTGELFSFYRIPKALFQEPRFQSLSTDAKTLYGILLDRMSLSVKNGWLDEQNRVFIIFTIEDVKRALCCADNKATKLLRELEKFGLIKDFDRYAKRYHIDYSIQKDLSCTPPRYLIYFKAQDTDALSAAFKEYSASVLDKTKRPSVLAKLHDLAQSVANLPDKVRNKQEERGL